MGIRYIGPGQTYATIADANAARSGADTFVCRFNTTDTTYFYSQYPTNVVADTGYTPAWRRAGALCAVDGNLSVQGLRVGRSDVGSSYLFAATAQAAAGIQITLEDCEFDVVGSHAIASMSTIAVGSSPLTLRMLRCTMAPGSNRFGTLQGVAGFDAAKVGRGHLLVEDCPLIDTNSLRVVAANGLFDEQSIKRSILRIYSASGAVGDFAAGAVCRIWQSLLDGMGSAGALVTANLAAMTLDIKSADIGHSASTAIVITNPAGQPIRNSAIHHNTFAGINASANVTDNCLFGNNGADYVGGGAVGASDILGIPTNTDRANADYTPDADSDTINVGTDEGFLTDIRGEAIPQGSDFDIGPYEFPEVTIVKLLTATATASDTVVITADGDLTAAIADIGDWAVTADNSGIADPVISSITIGVPNTEATIVFTADTPPREPYTIVSTAAEVDPAFNTLQYNALSVGARMVRAIFLDSIKTIIVEVDEIVTQGGTGGLGHWSQTLHSTFGDSIVLTDADVQSGSSAIIGLTYTGRPTPGARYQIVTDSAELEAGYRTVYAIMPIAAQDFTPEPVLSTMLSAAGKAIAHATGRPQTITTDSVTAGDTEIYVESTMRFPDTDGIIFIGGNRLTYTTKTSYSFNGVVWPTSSDGVTDFLLSNDFFVAGEPVTDDTGYHSLQDSATNNTIINRASGRDLVRLADALGFPVPLTTMTDADIRDYLNERMYQDTGTPLAVFRSIRPILRFWEVTDSTAVVAGAVTLQNCIVTDPIQQQSLVGRWVEVNGRIARIFSSTETVPGTPGNYTWVFCDFDSPLWEHPHLEELTPLSTTTWRLIPFLFNDVITRKTVKYTWPIADLVYEQCAQFDFHLFMGGTPPSYYPTGYWLADASVDMPGAGAAPPDGRSMHNYMAADHLTPAVPDLPNGDRFIYYLDNYDYQITGILSDLLPAGVIGNVYVY